MSNSVIFTAAYESLESLVADFKKALDGIPTEDLNSWKPAAEANGGGDMNTFAALAVHTASAGSWMIVHQVFGLDFPRERDLEFQATATRAEIDERFDNYLSRFAELAEAEADVDLSALPLEIRPVRPNWTRMSWLMHAIDHTALHLGHAEIQRQAWLAERATTP